MWVCLSPRTSARPTGASPALVTETRACAGSLISRAAEKPSRYWPPGVIVSPAGEPVAMVPAGVGASEPPVTLYTATSPGPSALTKASLPSGGTATPNGAERPDTIAVLASRSSGAFAVAVLQPGDTPAIAVPETAGPVLEALPVLEVLPVLEAGTVLAGCGALAVCAALAEQPARNKQLNAANCLPSA